MRVRSLGLVPYEETLRAMQHYTSARNAQSEDEIWLCQHERVFTLGASLRGADTRFARQAGIAVCQSDRGGRITYHAPGQVVAYALFDLKRAGFYVREYVARLQSAAVALLRQYGIAARLIKGVPGVFVADKTACAAPAPFSGLAKIAFLGVKLHQGCAYHGLSLNIHLDLAPFALIAPCGYVGLRVTDMSRSGFAGCTLPAQQERIAEDLAAAMQRSLAASAKTFVEVFRSVS